MFTPYAAQKILEAVPQYEYTLIDFIKIQSDFFYYRLRITADFSHWMVGLERLLDIGDGDRAIMDAIIPHVSIDAMSKYTRLILDLGLPHSHQNWNNPGLSMP